MQYACPCEYWCKETRKLSNGSRAYKICLPYMTWWQCLLYYHLIINLEVLLIIKVFIKSSMPCSLGSSLLCPVLMSLDCVRRPHRLTDCAHWGLLKYTRVRLTWKQSSGRKWNEAFSEPISSVKTYHWIETFGLHMTGGGTYCCHSSVETFGLHVTGGGTHCYLFLFGWLMTRT